MNAEQAVAFIHSRLQFGSKLGLETITQLLDRLGNPHKKLTFVHVAGTNGKGSTSSYLANILMAQGYKTGLYISPFVHSFAERISCNGKQIAGDALARCTKQVASVIGDGCEPTEFEVLTAVAMLYFLEQQCDYVVLEVGLGGRFDATNVIDAPVLSVITSISMDHMEQLGNTLEQIAFEKAGIIKAGSKLVLYPDHSPSVREVFNRVATQHGVPVFVGDMTQAAVLKQSMEGTCFSYEGTVYEIRLLGNHQVANAVTAITAARVLGVDTKSIQKGLLNTRFAGRFELVLQSPTALLDAAHNHAGVLALKQALQTYFGGKRIVVVMGMLQDKEVERCVEEIAPLACLFVATEPDSPRKMRSAQLADLARGHTETVVALSDRFEAARFALEQCGVDDVVCVCGSLYLIGGMDQTFWNEAKKQRCSK